ncbi:MAG: CRISPR-associated endonuclease Cas1 [Candidatus Bathyarchaeia archaeon]|jgi:CRISPR-associated protein Cas1
MKPLHLSGYGVKVKVQNLKSRSELEITDGREDDKTPSTMSFRPRRFPYSSVVIDGHSGYLSLQALHWLSRNKVPVFVMGFDGTLISSILPPMPVKADLRAAQLEAARDSGKKATIANAFVRAKITRSLQVLDWLAQRYDIEREVRATKREASRLNQWSSVNQLRTVEGRVALRYWETFRKALPEWLDFQGRMTATHQNNASDPFNAALNYGYGFLEAECRMAINAVGLEPAVGYLHDFSNYQTKESLVYDLQEPFRWLVDLCVIHAFESGRLDLHDFYFTGDDYRYRFEAEAKQRFIELLRERFNAGVAYKGQVLKWDTVIEQKTNELGRFLTGKASGLDFEEPAPNLDRHDDEVLRAKLLTLTSSQAKRHGIGKSTLHYLRRNAKAVNSFEVYTATREKLSAIRSSEV